MVVTAGKLYLHPRKVKDIRKQAAKQEIKILTMKLGKLTNRMELKEITQDNRLILNVNYERLGFIEH